MVYLEPGYGSHRQEPRDPKMRVEVDFKEGSRFSYNG